MSVALADKTELRQQMNKLASQADLCYNHNRNIVVPERCWKHRQALIHSLEECIMDILSSNTSQKQCSTCKQCLPATIEFFYPDKRRKDGFNNPCKACRKEQDQQPEKRARKLAYLKVYHQTPSGKASDQASYNRPENRENKRVRDKNRRSRPGFREQERVRERKYYYQPESRTRILTKNANRRAHRNAALGTYTVAQIQEQLKRQKHKCYYCSTKFECKQGKYIYDIDHTFPLSRANKNDPINSIDYLVLACPSCNRRKHNKYPHEFFEGGKLL